MRDTRKRITYVREKWGRFKGELIEFNSLETLAEPGTVTHDQNGHSHETQTAINSKTSRSTEQPVE